MDKIITTFLFLLLNMMLFFDILLRLAAPALHGLAYNTVLKC